jgi:hypothetical protein
MDIDTPKTEPSNTPPSSVKRHRSEEDENRNVVRKLFEMPRCTPDYENGLFRHDTEQPGCTMVQQEGKDHNCCELDAKNNTDDSMFLQMAYLMNCHRTSFLGFPDFERYMREMQEFYSVVNEPLSDLEFVPLAECSNKVLKNMTDLANAMHWKDTQFDAGTRNNDALIIEVPEIEYGRKSYIFDFLNSAVVRGELIIATRDPFELLTKMQNLDNEDCRHICINVIYDKPNMIPEDRFAKYMDVFKKVAPFAFIDRSYTIQWINEKKSLPLQFQNYECTEADINVIANTISDILEGELDEDEEYESYDLTKYTIDTIKCSGTMALNSLSILCRERGYQIQFIYNTKTWECIIKKDIKVIVIRARHASFDEFSIEFKSI